MDALQVVIDPADWGDLVTKYQPYSPNLTSADFTDGTINLDTDTNGSLIKRKGGPNYNGTLLSGTPKDQFEAIFSDGARHLLVVANGEIRYSTGDTVFNAIVNGTGYSVGANFEFATTQDRVYGGNGITNGIVYDRATSYGGVTYTAPRIKTIGAQAPASAPSGAVTAGGSIPVGGHTYKITFLYYDAEESNGGPASSVFTTSAGNQKINLTAIPIGGYGVTARNIYRDNNDGNWVFIDQISNNTATTYSDVTSVSATPTPIPTDNSLPSVFKYITNWVNRLWLSGIPGDPSILEYSEADQPDLYGSENQILCNPEDPITATIVYFDRLVVFNRRSFGQIIGSTPDNFRYAAIPSSIGCVDNRTLQIHVLHDVPVLVWLSERGFYTYDGNSINYISDKIEDLVNFNIRQAIQQKNSNTQSSQTQFQSGVASNGIDLLSFPGSITTKGYLNGTSTPGNNPRRTFDDSTDWDNGSQQTNISTEDGTNTLKMPTTVGFDPSAGTLTGTVSINRGDGNHVELPTSTVLQSDSTANGTNVGSATYHAIAMKFIASASGTVTAGALSGQTNPGNTYHVYSHDATNDRPLASIGAVGSVSVFASTTYWLVLDQPTPFTVATNRLATNGCFTSVRTVTGNKAMTLTGAGAGVWFDIGTSSTGTTGFGNSSFTITSFVTSLGGQWTSVIADSFSHGSVGFRYYVKGSYPSGTTGTVIIEGSNAADFSSIVTTQSFSNPNGFLTATVSGARYWRTRVQLTTTNNSITPSIGGQPSSFTNSFVLEFARTATWISEAIDTTADSTVYNSMPFAASNFGGSVPTSTAVTIATSADNITYSSFVAFGSHTVRRYAKIQIVMTSGSNFGAIPVYFTNSPIVTSVGLSWTMVSNLVSSAIDTAVTPPAGWDVFLAQFTLNSGTVQFFFTSAPSIPQLGDGGHPFVAVSSGNFPTNTAFQYAQWKVVITSSDLAVPSVDSITVQWFISNVASIRPASIFVDGRYYVALAELSQTANNLILEIDLKGKWRRLSGLSVATFSFFFNRPYFGISSAGQIRKFLEGYDDAGTAIELDIRSKAIDFSSPYKDVSEKQKIVGELIVHAKNTGALLQFFYSVDDGDTFYPFYTLDGSTAYQTDTTGTSFFLRLKPSWTNGNPIAGQHIMYRVYNNDLNQVEVHKLKATALLRKQPPVITG